MHTNTHIPQVIGAARRYELSSDMRFHDVADAFWHQVADTRTYVSGGTSNNEGWLTEPNHLGHELSLRRETNECCWATTVHDWIDILADPAGNGGFFWSRLVAFPVGHQNPNGQ